MRTHHFEILAKDGLALRGKSWLPSDDPHKIICLVHGHGEHIGRYEHMASFFASHSVAFYAVDMRGHGQSDGKKGHIPNYDIILSDIEELIKVARLDYLDTPIVLYGHSLGGNYVANYLITNKVKEVASAVISSPWIKLALTPPTTKVLLAKAMRRIWPSYTERSKLDANGLSRDKSIVQAYIDDPLVHDYISVNLFVSASMAGEEALAKAHELATKSLVIHGSNDPITSAVALQEFASRANVDFKLWDDMLHEPHNEIGKEKVLEYVLNWMDGR